MTSLAQSILQTLIFFDAQDMTLMLAEIRGYLIAVRERRNQLTSLSEIKKVLEVELPQHVPNRQGFYFLNGRQELVASRRYRYKISLQRFRKARRLLYPLKFIPYLRAVAISGSQALLNSHERSDIDLFVITKKNRVWLARFLVSLYFELLGQRRHGRHIPGRFCLNHYLAEHTPVTKDQNLYTAVEYASLIPVLGEEVFREFWEENHWLREFLAYPVYERINPFFQYTFSPLQRFFELLLDWTGGALFNWLAGIYQKKRIKMQEYILISDEELSFHPGSRGQKVLAKFSEKLRAFRSA